MITECEEKMCIMSSTADIMHIFFASDENFAMHLTAVLSSILLNANDNDFHFFHILDDDISDRSKQIILELKRIKDFDIEFIKIDNNIFKDCPLVPNCSHITRQTYYRYIIPKIKPQLEKVLYLDCDIIVKKSLSDLYNIDLGDKYCAVVQEMNPYFSPKDEKRLGINAEFNAGVILFNNRKLVEENLTPVFFENTQKLYEQGLLVWQDQDVLNYTFKDNVLWLNPKYNYQQNMGRKPYYTEYCLKELNDAKKNIVIVHYNNNHKPWKFNTDFYAFDYYFALLNTKYVKKAIKYILYYVLKSKFTNIYRFLFSAKNSGDRTHKIITILGIKFKFRRKKHA